MIKKLLFSCFLLFILGFVGLVVAANQFYRATWQEPSAAATPQTFEVPQGQAFAGAAADLQANGIIRSSFWFRVTAELAGSTDDLKAGTYELTPGLAYLQILDVITDTMGQGDVEVTIPEGYTLEQMGELFVGRGLLGAEEWALYTGANSPLESHPFIASANKPDDVDLEGYLFPDTYRFRVSPSSEEVVQLMLDTMQTKFTALDVTSPSAAEMTTHEVLTLASIVEREVRQPATMKNVADIFLKRLEIGMALQSDATINYIIAGDDPSPSLDDLEVESPYNTYKYPGLPPGPISSPGVNALSAVLSPTPNDYLYFLTTDEGQIYYAKTHEEHVANKEKYLK